MKEATVRTKNSSKVVIEYRKKLGDQHYEVVQPRPVGFNFGQPLTGVNDNTQRKAWAHDIFRVRLKATGKYFAIDLSGAQHGSFDTVIPWTTYEAEKVSRILELNPLGTFKADGNMQFIIASFTLEGDFTVRYLDLMKFLSAKVMSLWLSEKELDDVDHDTEP